MINHFFNKKEKKVILLYFSIAVIIWFIYSGLLIKGKFRSEPDNFNYFKNLAISFLNGRLDIPKCPEGTDCHDMINYHGKRYLYEPPVPAILYIPLVLIWKENTPDSLISSFFGALNVLFIFLFLKLFSNRYNLNLSEFQIIILGVFWGLGTVNFFLSMSGGVWYISQVIAQTFLILSLIFIMLDKIKNFIFLSGLFFTLAVYTRNNLIFFVFFIVAIYISKHKEEIINKDRLKKFFLSFFLMFIIFSVLNLAYNGLRFNGKIFSNGINHHQMSERFKNDFKKFGYFSPVYIPKNFIREVIIPPPFSKDFPFFKVDPEGFGFIWGSPFFILCFLVLSYIFIIKIIEKNNKLEENDFFLLKFAIISLFLNMILIFTVMNNGWFQFGSRYSLDYQVLLLTISLYAFKIWQNNFYLKIISIILILISIYVNYFGTIKYFYN